MREIGKVKDLMGLESFIFTTDLISKDLFLMAK
jgi:hypothetical protein